jgi:hypothetical protein
LQQNVAKHNCRVLENFGIKRAARMKERERKRKKEKERERKARERKL